MPSPAPQAVYQDVRWAPSFTYTIVNLTPGSSYLVRLHFCELSFTASGQRVFNVAVNGTNVFPGIRYTGRLAGDPLGQMAAAAAR